MKYVSNVILLPIALLVLSCNKKNKDEIFGEAKNLSLYKNTNFSPTLEHKIHQDTNAVYCVTLLYAWNEIVDEIGKPWGINKKDTDLLLLSKSNSFLNALDQSDYFSNVEVDGTTINASVFFKKSLPFEFKLNSYDKKLKFNDIPVKSFGVNGWDDEISDLVTMLYYKNDENFIIKLSPEDKNHEIILFKTEAKYNSLIEMNQSLMSLTDISMDEKQNWRFNFLNDDILVIPKLNFNIETNFKKIEGKLLNGFDNQYKIETAYQRIGFVLDENGAEIESEVEVVVEAIEEIIDREIPKPKKLIFDKPFYVLLRKKETTNPYFVLWNVNAELLVEDKKKLLQIIENETIFIGEFG